MPIPTPGVRAFLATVLLLSAPAFGQDVRAGRERASEASMREALDAEKDPLKRIRLLRVLSNPEQSADPERPRTSRELPEDPAGELALVLRTDPHPWVRQAAAEALARLGPDRAAIEALGHALERDRASPVRYAAALSLALLDGPEALEALRKAAADPDPKLRRQVAYGLRHRPRPGSEALLERLSKDSDPEVRRLAGGSRP